MTLTELQEQSRQVALVRVLSASTRATEKMVWTDYKVAVETVVRGDLPSTAVLSFAGGATPEKEILVVGVPRLRLGETYLLFLRGGDEPYATPTVGWDQGAYRQVTASYRGRVVDLFLSERGHPLEVTDSGQLKRGDRLVLMEEADGGVPTLVEAPLRSVEDGERNADPIVVDPGGMVQPLDPPLPVPGGLPEDGERRFASVQTVRDFVDGEIEEVDHDGR